MLKECGHRVDLYDKFYAKNDVVFEKQYDFITASEVVEHLKQPMVELNRLMGLLKSNGVLAIMTQILTPQIDFEINGITSKILLILDFLVKRH